MNRFPHMRFSLLQIVALVITSVAFGGTPNIAHAEPEDEGSVLGWFSFTPRLWVAAVDTIDFDDLAKDIYVVPMVGISVTMAPPVIPDLSFAFTVLGGEGNGDALFTGGVNPFKVDGEVTRVDVEILGRYQLFDSPFAVFAGPRFITFDEKYKDNFGGSIQSENDIVALQFGIGAATDLGTSGRHRLFANVMTGVAFIDATFDAPGVDASDETEDPLFDLNTGYQFILNDNFSFSARYRVFMVFSENDFGFESTFLVHGPEFGATMRFN